MAIEDWLRGTAQQAEDRRSSCVRCIDSYFDIRHKTIGAVSSLNMLEMEMNIPDEVFTDPIVRSLMDISVDLTIIINVSGRAPLRIFPSFVFFPCLSSLLLIRSVSHPH